MSLNSAKIFASRAIVSCHTSRNKNTSFKLFLYTQKLLCGNRNGLQLGCNFQWEKSYQTISSINLEKCNIIRSPCKELMLPDNVSLPEFVWEEGIKHHQDKLALINGVTGRSYTYKEGNEDCKKFAIALKAFGIKKGDVAALFMPNCPEYILCLLGVAAIGAITTTINPNYTPHEISKQLIASDAKLVVTIPSLINIVKEALQKISSKVHIIILDEDHVSLDKSYPTYQNLIEQVSKNEAEKFQFQSDTWNEIALLPYSSGTTGLPKGVMLTTKNLVSNIYQNVHGEELDFIKRATSAFQSKIICVLPMFHIFGLFTSCMPTLRAGGQVITIPKFEPNLFATTLEKYRPTFLHLVPPLVAFCANNEIVTSNHLDSVEHIMAAGAPVGEALIDIFHKKAPKVVFREGWGMTETSPSVCQTQDKTFKPGSCGYLLPNTEAKIVDLKNGNALGPNEKGELCIRGPQVMKGYLNNENATKETIREGNWLHSGDIAYYDESFRFYIVDRLKELIKVKGFQVAPAELEDLVRSHADVKDVAVIGIPDKIKGEVPLAFIVTKEENVDKELIKDSVHKFVNEHVSEYKQLGGGIRIVETIPKSASGKILRKDLKALFTKTNEK